MIPKRFGILRPYLASFIHSGIARPPLGEVAAWFLQKSPAKRAAPFIEDVRKSPTFYEVKLRGHDRIFHYPLSANWSDFCALTNELMNERHWHCYDTGATAISPDDIVVDCGAAEGLFSFLVAPFVKQVYAIEPVPFWHPGLEKMFTGNSTVQLIPCGLSHKETEVFMTENEGGSKISRTGTVPIQCKTIDSLFHDKNIPISYLKADIEGFEFEMLLGAENTIRKCRPKIALAIYHIENYVPQITSYLRRIHGDYQISTKGIAPNGNPMLLQAR